MAGCLSKEGAEPQVSRVFKIEPSIFEYLKQSLLESSRISVVLGTERRYPRRVVSAWRQNVGQLG
jgi:hypothetical protein